MTSTPNQPLVSVLMPVFNTAHWVLDACRSVLEQTHADLELVVVDDGSTDGGGALVGSLDDARVRVLTTPHLGEAAARNRCLDEARGTFITWQDADDVSSRDRIALQLSAMADGIDLVHHDVTTMDAQGVPTGHRRRNQIASRHFMQAALRHGDPFLPGTTMVRRSAFNGLRLDVGLRYAADGDLLRRLGSRVTSAHIPEPLLHQREHSESMTGRTTSGDAWAPVGRLISQEPLRTLVPTAFQVDWLPDGEVVARAFVVLSLQRRGFSVEAVQHLDRLSPCSTRAGALTVAAVLDLAQDDPAAALRWLSRVPANAFSTALAGDAHRFQRATAAAEACFRRALQFDEGSFDAADGLRALGFRTPGAPALLAAAH